MRIARIVRPDATLLFQILELVHEVDTSFTLKQYTEYVTEYSEVIGLFGYFDGELRGYVHAEAPHPLEPDIGFINIVTGRLNISKKIKQQTLQLVEQWLKEQGAKMWRMTTKKNPAIWRRRWGLEYVGEVDGEFILQKEIKELHSDV